MNNPFGEIVSNNKSNLTADGWVNVLTGLNVVGKDKNLGASISWRPTDRGRCEGLFAADDLGGKIAKTIPFDGTRAGITWKVPSSSDVRAAQGSIDFVESECDRLDFWGASFWAWSLARAYGGSVIYVSLDDSMDIESPVKLSRIRKINSLRVFDRWELSADTTSIISDLSDPNYGYPEYYHYNPNGSFGVENNYVRIHHSRLIRFDGERLPDRLYVSNNYWHDSIFTKLYDALRNYTTGQGALASVIQETNQACFKIEGLHEAISQDEDELVYKRIQIINELRSSMRAVVLDKEDDFVFMQTALTGVSNLMSDLTSRLVAASEIPHTRLLGESTSGLSDKSRSVLIDYYDMVASSQKMNLSKPIQRMRELVFAQRGVVSDTENMIFTFNPLFQQDLEAQIRTRQIQATIDKMYMDNGVYAADEVAFNRFSSGEYSFETSLDDRERPVVNETSVSSTDNGLEDPTNVAVKEAEVFNQNTGGSDD